MIEQRQCVACALAFCLLFVCASVACAEGPESKPVMVPRIDGDWWQVSYSPELPEIGSKPGQVVDHCFFKAKSGRWQLWTQIRGTSRGRLFYRWEGGDKFEKANWQPKGICWRASKKHGESIGTGPANDIIQAPCVMTEDGRYALVYGGGPTDKSDRDRQVCMATSDDGLEFTRVLNPDGLGRVVIGPRHAADAMLLKHEGQYLLFIGASYYPSEAASAAVTLRTAKTLEGGGKWSEFVVVHGGGTCGTHTHSSQSAFVMFLDGYFYLFKMGWSNEYRTAVYRSKKPTFFGKGDEQLVTVLPVSAAEVIQEGDQFYISSLIPGYKGVRVARLKWVEKK